MDLKNALNISTTLAPAARTASANGAGVDLANFGGAMFVAVVGVITDGTHALTVEESDDNAAFTAVAASDLVGSFANLASNANQEVGYRGAKRFVRVNAGVTGATTGGVYAVAVVRGGARKQPV